MFEGAAEKPHLTMFGNSLSKLNLPDCVRMRLIMAFTITRTTKWTSKGTTKWILKWILKWISLSEEAVQRMPFGFLFPIEHAGIAAESNVSGASDRQKIDIWCQVCSKFLREAN